MERGDDVEKQFFFTRTKLCEVGFGGRRQIGSRCPIVVESWTLIDEDTLLPHNVVRHRLGENTVGFPKAIALRCASVVETPHNPVERAFAEDFLSIKDNSETRLRQ